MSMSKIKDIKLETTANYQPLSDLNVRFWNQDKNTAELRFIITRNQFPLSLSKENVKVIIALESGSSFISSDDFIIDSEVEGVARYIIPTDFMRVASNVTGQIYVTTLDKEEIIVERQFKFTVSNDLLNDYPSEDKLRYIKTFDDLRNEIASRVSKLESDMETMEDYVVQVQDTTQEGITALTNLIKQKQDAYNANHTAKMKELNDKGSEYSAKFDDDKVYMDEKHESFKESVLNSEVVTQGESKEWQKHKMTQSNGDRIRVSDIDPVELDTGYYQIWRTYNMPETADGSPAYWNVDVFSALDTKQIRATLSGENRVFQKNIHMAEDLGWKELISLPLDEEVETKSSSEQRGNEILTDANQYTDEKFSKQHTVLFEGSANGVNTEFNLTDSIYNYSLIMISGEFPGGTFNEPVLVSNVIDNITIQRFNLTDAEGQLVKFYESSVNVKNGIKPFIRHDVAFDYKNLKPSGKDNNAFTITKVEGWK